MNKAYMTELRCALAGMLLWGMSAQAGDISITTTKSEYVPGGVRYYFEVTGWDTSNTRSPCSSSVSWDEKVTRCMIQLNARYNTNAVGSYASWTVPYYNNEKASMLTLLQDLTKQGFRLPLSGSIFVDSKKVSPDICIGFAYLITNANNNYFPGTMGTCYKVAAPSLQCDFTGNSVIDHMRLVDNAVEGATASTQVDVQCKGASTLIVSTSQTDAYGVRLNKDGSLYSKITVNGKDATTGITVPITQGQSAPLTITSTLVKRGDIQPGEFSGSTVITISPP
ncbi:hypothetical protein SAMN05216248_105164 [Pseudomonas simiae]|uniref:MrpH family fimbial adhesin n=1 Tax=Pseudomonas simiae TaxID=321846 RepID=UPI0008E490DC|nr:hypothetical protein [Pseudomonas simiae]SFB39385.1 hypothetical protein SAMN05216248_105164 [Pseudomonas simiae]